MGDNITLLDYGHQFMGSLHIVDSRSWTLSSSSCYLDRILECSWFSLVNIESTLEFDYKGGSTLIGPSGPHFELIYHDGMVYDGWIGSWFILVHKDVLVIT